MTALDETLKASVLFRNLEPEDRKRVAAVALARTYDKGEVLFHEGDEPHNLYTIVRGRVKVVRAIRSGKEIIIEIFGPGDPVGAVVAYEGAPYPASAIATERTLCLLVRRADFFALLERHPSIVRGYLVGMAHRIAELTRRIPEVAAGRVEARFANLFLKLAERLGRPHGGGVFIAFPLTRRELADLTGTTTETAIRLMSRWGKDGVVLTQPDGFVVVDRRALESIAQT